MLCGWVGLFLDFARGACDGLEMIGVLSQANRGQQQVLVDPGTEAVVRDNILS